MASLKTAVSKPFGFNYVEKTKGSFVKKKVWNTSQLFFFRRKTEGGLAQASR